MYIYTLEVLVKFQLKLLIIIYKSKIHLVNTKCWTQQTLTQYTIHQSNQIKSRKFIFIFSSFYIYFFLNFIKFEVIFFNTSLIDRLFFFSFFFFSFFFCITSTYIILGLPLPFFIPLIWINALFFIVALITLFWTELSQTTSFHFFSSI